MLLRRLLVTEIIKIGLTILFNSAGESRHIVANNNPYFKKYSDKARNFLLDIDKSHFYNKVNIWSQNIKIMQISYLVLF